ncbi:uncharacterized protein LOC131156193 isoform X2 [Malania oleifera]|nr:uncharacterized protein LOC131156193 isoform X2 [Malania oleifera]
MTSLVISLNKDHLQQIMILLDYLCICRLREKYGRYRPSCSPSSGIRGWQILWWHYAQESVLSDVRKKLKRTSWRYCGQRLGYCRKYVNLYKKKLRSLQLVQPMDADVIRELEQMEEEKDLDVEDILNLRLTAEQELQELVSNSSTTNMGMNDSPIAVVSSGNDELSTVQSRGWLAWLSRGVLGVGGTDDSSQFSSVVSDDVAKENYEETKFHAGNLSSGDVAASDKNFLCRIRVSIHQISATLWSKMSCQDISKLTFSGAVVKCELFKKSAAIIVMCMSADMVNPYGKGAIRLMRRDLVHKDDVDGEDSSCCIKMDVSSTDGVELLVKGLLQTLEVTFDTEYFVYLMEFFDVLKSFNIQNEKELLLLNGIEDSSARLLSKAEYILSSHRKVVWDVRLVDIIAYVPLQNALHEQFSLVLRLGTLLLRSKSLLDSSPSIVEEQPYTLKKLFGSSSFSKAFGLEDLYDYFEVKINDIEMKILMSDQSEAISIFEKLGAFISITFCMIPDESIPKQLEVHIILSTQNSYCDLHCYPFVVGLLIGFFDRLSAYGTSSAGNRSISSTVDTEISKAVSAVGFQSFGFSNFRNEGCSEWASIPLDHFPFVTVKNSGWFGNLDGSLLYNSSDWRKYFYLMDTPKFSLRKGSRFFNTSLSKSTTGIEAFLDCWSAGIPNALVIDLHLSGIRVHFHDSSCIVGTVTLPDTKSLMFIYEDSIDILCSAVGLSLTSSWCTQNFQEFLWGPSSPNLSPVLNLRVRKENSRVLDSQFEVSIGVQHVCCILTPEYLSIIIGYFSLSDWSSSSNGLTASEVCGDTNTENDSSIVCRFEVLDASLILPVESNQHQFLKFEIQQLYCSSYDCFSNKILDDVCPEYFVLLHEPLEEKYHCINVFGLNLILSSLLFMDDGHGCLTNYVDSSLVASLNLDIWVRTPCESQFPCKSSPSTFVIARTANCQVTADGDNIFYGFEALLDVINQFSSVPDQSKCFKSDVLQFLQLKRSLRENISPIASSTIFTEVWCYVDSLLIKFLGFQKEPVAQAKMRFKCSAKLTTDTLLSLGLDFSSFEFSSLPNSLVLAQFNSTSTFISVLEICLSATVNGEGELCVSLPSADIWLHMPDWTKVVESIAHSVKQLTKAVDPLENSNVSVSLNSFDSSSVPPHFAPENKKQDAVVRTVRSENISITFHFPVWVHEEAHRDFHTAGKCDDATEGKDCKFISVTFYSKNIEIFKDAGDFKLKSNSEKMSGAVLVREKETFQSLPLFHLFQVNVEAEVTKNHMDPLHVKVEIQCDHSDLWVSHHVFYLWHDLQINFLEADSSPFVFGGIVFEVLLRRVSILLSGGRWSCSGPLFQVLMKDVLLHANVAENSVDGSITGDLQANYNNIHNVSWEPFIEPWQFHITVVRKDEMGALVDDFVMTDIQLKSIGQLNLNITESLIECVFMTIEMIKDTWGLMQPYDLPEHYMFYECPYTDTAAGRYAPYMLKNLTSVPLLYHVYQGIVNREGIDVSDVKDKNYVQPGGCVPIFINEAPEEQLFHYRPLHSSNRLHEQESKGVARHFITIQLDGMSLPSAPLSMDLVKLTYFEVDFFGNYKYCTEESRLHTNSGIVVPVVFDVSVQRHCKLIQLYSTVVLMNATSMPLELWIDIPFGVSAKKYGPIHPGQELPLPLHFSRADRVRWCPMGDSYLCSEAYDLSSLISQESKIGNFKSFVCYPSRVSGHPLHCCLSVRNIRLHSSGHPEACSSLHMKGELSVENSGQVLHNLDESKMRFLHQVTISTPLVVNNYLPTEVSVSICTVGSDLITCTNLSEMGTSFHHIDPSHDLQLEINMHGFKPLDLKFPRRETFTTMAKLNGTKFSLSETARFIPCLSSGPLYVSVEKMMDAFSGARELFIFVHFLLYNCTGFSLLISESSDEMTGVTCSIPPCHVLVEDHALHKKDGLSLLSTSQNACPHNQTKSVSEDHGVSTGTIVRSGRFLRKSSISTNSPLRNSHEQSNNNYSDHHKDILENLKNGSPNDQFCSRDANIVGYEHGNVRPYMYSPKPLSSTGELVVRVRRCLHESVEETLPNPLWSSPFPLVPASGSMAVLVPQLSSSASFVISVTSSAVSGLLVRRTNAITFQPRYIISNACSKDLFYKQKGTSHNVHLKRGDHAHLHWTDTTRELLVSVCFDERGWHWSGSFSPDHLGDIQVKMRNSSGALNIIRVEVQNADVSTGDEKIVGSIDGNSGTNLILLSDDDMGYMPYRIDNFSKETLRIYQRRCEISGTIVHSYASCPYAWDEPCYPHHLIVEVPGERFLGSFQLDDVKAYMPVYLPSTSEKPERRLCFSVHAEGATKVLSVIDSSCHIFDDMNNSSLLRFREKRKHDQKHNKFVNCKEKISVFIPYMTFSLISSCPQELIFACAKNVTINLLQSLDQQKLSFHISSLQIDNPSHSTPYPVMLSFNHGYRCDPAGQLKTNDDCSKARTESILQMASDNSCEPVVYLTVSRWRKKDVSLVSFEYIIIRVADFCLELEEELILSLVGFFKSVSSMFQCSVLAFSKPSLHAYQMDPSTEVWTSDYTTRIDDHFHWMNVNLTGGNNMSSQLLPLVVPIGAPGQQIYLLARRQKKIYVEVFDFAPINCTLSFSSTPWMHRNGVLSSGESLLHRGLMALADVEGAQINFKQLSVEHIMASSRSIQEIFMRHYTRQLLHEMYKVFGSAGVIGNPVGFARNMVLGVREFLSVPAKSILQNRTGLITGMAQGTTGLLSNTIYAVSDAATQFSKAAHKGILAFTFDDQAVSKLEKRRTGVASYSKGVINEVLEGLTGLLQSPIEEAEKHGLPGILSGMALGVTGLVAKPAASILEVTGKTAQSIRNRSRISQTKAQRFRARLPRPLRKEIPLRPYSWEEAIGASILIDTDDGLKLKSEVLVICKALKQAGKFVVITKRLVIVVSWPSLIDLGKPEFQGIAIDSEWVIEIEINLESVIHYGIDKEVVHIVLSSQHSLMKQNLYSPKRSSGARSLHFSNCPALPIFVNNLELPSEEDAQCFLQILKSTIEGGEKHRGGYGHILHQCNIK